MFGRTGILALGVDIAVDELDHRHRRVVAIAEAGLDDAGIAALAVLVAGRQRVEQLLGHLDVAHLTDRLTAHRKAALLAERDQLLHDRAQFLGFRQRGDDLLMLDQRRAHVGEHRAPMLGGAIELPMNPAVTHSLFLTFSSAATVRRTSCSGGLPAFARSFQTSQCGDPESRIYKKLPDSGFAIQVGCCRLGSLQDRTRVNPSSGRNDEISNDPRSAWPARRCSPAASPALPCRDAGPSAPALP